MDKFAEELEAGRAAAAREGAPGLDEEVEASRVAAARARERLELEQEGDHAPRAD